MKKYNKSEIMNNAWNIYRNHKAIGIDIEFAECLRRAWAKAKTAEPEKKSFNGFARIDGFEFNLWSNYGKTRIYINNCSGHNMSNKGGYIDLDNGNAIRATGSVKDAAKAFIKNFQF
jgi:hypothetical protein